MKYTEFLNGSNPRHFDLFIHITPQEKRLLGGTPHEQPGSNIWYTPYIIQEKGIGAIEEAIEFRKRFPFTAEQIMACLLGIRTHRLALSLEQLDPSTGMTIADPQILGIILEKQKIVKKLRGRNLTQEYYAQFEKFNRDLGRRNP